VKVKKLKIYDMKTILCGHRTIGVFMICMIQTTTLAGQSYEGYIYINYVELVGD
jgi:hypothetical protein